MLLGVCVKVLSVQKLLSVLRTEITDVSGSFRLPITKLLKDYMKYLYIFFTLKMKVDDNRYLYFGILIIDEKIFLEVNPPFPSIFPIENPYNKNRFKVA